MRRAALTHLQGRVLPAAILSLAAIALSGCGSSSSGDPRQTVTAFLQAAAAGDGAKACAQLSPVAREQVVHGMSCEQGIKLAGVLYRSLISEIEITGVRVRGHAATATATFRGETIGTYRLDRSSGRWLITDERRTDASGGRPGAVGPSRAQVDAVARCLSKSFGIIGNYGSDTTGGVRHVVLGVDIDRYISAEVNVFASPGDARAGFPGIKAHEGRVPTLVSGSSVISYLRPVSAARRQVIEACG